MYLTLKLVLTASLNGCQRMFQVKALPRVLTSELVSTAF